MINVETSIGAAVINLFYSVNKSKNKKKMSQKIDENSFLGQNLQKSETSHT